MHDGPGCCRLGSLQQQHSWLTCLAVPLPPAEADALRLTHGLNELEEKSTPKWLVYLNMVSISPLALFMGFRPADVSLPCSAQPCSSCLLCLSCPAAWSVAALQPHAPDYLGGYHH